MEYTKEDFCKFKQGQEFWNKETGTHFLISKKIKKDSTLFPWFIMIKMVQEDKTWSKDLDICLLPQVVEFEFKGKNLIIPYHAITLEEPNSSITLTEPNDLKNNQDHMIIKETSNINHKRDIMDKILGIKEGDQLKTKSYTLTFVKKTNDSDGSLFFRLNDEKTFTVVEVMNFGISIITSNGKENTNYEGITFIKKEESKPKHDSPESFLSYQKFIRSKVNDTFSFNDNIYKIENIDHYKTEGSLSISNSDYDKLKNVKFVVRDSTIVTEENEVILFDEMNWISKKYLTHEEHTEAVKEINLIHKAPHYNFGKYEVIKVIEDYHLGFSSGNALKYLARAGKKDKTKTLEDLNKARYYLRREHSRPEAHNPKDNMEMSPRLIVSDWKLNYNIGSAVIKLLEYNYALKASEVPREFSLADAISSLDLEIEYQQGLLDERK